MPLSNPVLYPPFLPVQYANKSDVLFLFLPASSSTAAAAAASNPDCVKYARDLATGPKEAVSDFKPRVFLTLFLG